MGLTLDRRAELGDRPGTHALVCGVGRYPAAEAGSLSRWDLQVADPAAVQTARRIHDWLIEHSGELAAPLATCRLLLSAEGEGATLFELLHQAAEWREDASAHPGGMTFCYLAGAGLSLSRAETVVLLEDFGAPVGGLLRSAIIVESIVQGMMPSEWAPDLARTQLVFADLVTPPGLLLAGRGSDATPVFDVPPYSTLDDRNVMKVAALTSGRRAGRDATSLFCEVLLESLEGGAGELVEDGTWAVTTTGLGRALSSETDRREQESASPERTRVTWEGMIGGGIVTRLASPPSVPVEVRVTGHVGKAELVVRDGEFNVIFAKGVRTGSAPIHLQLKSGIFLFELHGPHGEPTRTTAAVTPPTTTIVLRQSEAPRDG